MVTAGIFPFKENSYGRTGNRTRDLMISSQKLRPLDHEAGLKDETCRFKMEPIGCPETSLENYHSTLRVVPEERTFLLNRGRSLKPRIRSSYKRFEETCICNKNEGRKFDSILLFSTRSPPPPPPQKKDKTY